MKGLAYLLITLSAAAWVMTFGLAFGACFADGGEWRLFGAAFVSLLLALFLTVGAVSSAIASVIEADQ